jgi:hypothetical protein
MRKLIRTDGSSLQLPAGLPMKYLMALIGASTGSLVRLHHLGEPLHVMLVDDMGYHMTVRRLGKGRFEFDSHPEVKPVNPEATALYLANCRPGATHRVVGDVVVVPDSDLA